MPVPLSGVYTMEALREKLSGKSLTERYNMTFKEVFEEWKVEHYREIGEKGVESYDRAYDVFEPLLPLEPDVLVLLENIERELDEVVVVEAEALFLLIEIAVEDDVPRRVGALVLFAQRVGRHRDHVLVILRLLKELSDLDHVPCGGIGHVAQCEAALFVDDAEHRVDVGIIQHEEALRVLHRMAVLLQNGDTEAVERVDIARVVVAGQGVDTLAHLVG